MSSDFLQAYEDNFTRVYGYVAYRVAKRADAEDLTQVTFERAWKAWDRFDPRRATATTWLIAIARNAIIDHRRRSEARPAEVPMEDMDEGVLAEAQDFEASLGPDAETVAALGRLSERERSVVALRFGADLGGPEIAELLDISLANAQQILSRALRKLRWALAPESQPGPQDESHSSGDAKTQ